MIACFASPAESRQYALGYIFDVSLSLAKFVIRDRIIMGRVAIGNKFHSPFCIYVVTRDLVLDLLQKCRIGQHHPMKIEDPCSITSAGWTLLTKSAKLPDRQSNRCSAPAQFFLNSILGQLGPEVLAPMSIQAYRCTDGYTAGNSLSLDPDLTSNIH